MLMIAFENNSKYVIDFLIPRLARKRAVGGKTTLMFCVENDMIEGVGMMTRYEARL